MGENGIKQSVMDKFGVKDIDHVSKRSYIQLFDKMVKLIDTLERDNTFLSMELFRNDPLNEVFSNLTEKDKVNYRLYTINKKEKQIHV